jgi:hypothetical protein
MPGNCPPRGVNGIPPPTAILDRTRWPGPGRTGARGGGTKDAFIGVWSGRPFMAPGRKGGGTTGKPGPTALPSAGLNMAGGILFTLERCGGMCRRGGAWRGTAMAGVGGNRRYYTAEVWGRLG